MWARWSPAGFECLAVAGSEDTAVVLSSHERPAGLIRYPPSRALSHAYPARAGRHAITGETQRDAYRDSVCLYSPND
jgi:hypothetical protein